MKRHCLALSYGGQLQDLNGTQLNTQLHTTYQGQLNKIPKTDQTKRMRSLYMHGSICHTAGKETQVYIQSIYAFVD